MAEVKAYFSIRIVPGTGYPVQAIPIGMVSIIAKLKSNIYQYHQANSHPDCKTQEIDRDIERMLFGISDDDFEVVFYHGLGRWL